MGSVVQSYQRRGTPIVFAETLGYRGTNFTGHETVVRSILDQYVAKLAGPAPEVRKGLVNVWSLLPYQNPFWRGDLAEIRRILEGIGLTVNILFGPASEGLQQLGALKKRFEALRPEMREHLQEEEDVGLPLMRKT